MGLADMPRVNKVLDNKGLSNVIAMLIKELEVINGRLDSKNLREIAGYLVSQTELKHLSGVVGMSGADAADPEAIRFWSGNADKEAAPFRVQQDGTMYATNGNFEGKISASDIDGGTITGALIQTDEAGVYPRIGFDPSNHFISVEQSATNYTRMQPDAFGSAPGIEYHNSSSEASMILLGAILAILTPAGVADIQISSGKDLFLRASNTIRLSGSSLTINNIPTFTGSFSTGTQTVTVVNGLITSVI